MELRQLHYFVAVAEELHFARAVLRVYIAQQALQSLERELVQLLVFTTRRVELTRAGAIFYDVRAVRGAVAAVVISDGPDIGFAAQWTNKVILLLEKIGRLDTKGSREPINYLYARAINRSFKGADVGAVKLRTMRKFLLRQSFGLAEAPQILGKSFAYLHNAREIDCRVFHHGVFSTFDLIGSLICYHLFL